MKISLITILKILEKNKLFFPKNWVLEFFNRFQKKVLISLNQTNKPIKDFEHKRFLQGLAYPKLFQALLHILQTFSTPILQP